MSDKPAKLLRRLRRFLSRSGWSARLLNRQPCEGSGAGLVLLQIDGLSCTQMMRALAKKRLPFIARQLRRQQAVLQPWYCGVPSSTPAVQAELYYGVPTAVPAFEYMRRSTRERFVMYDSDAARRIDAELAAEHRGLLEGGTSYSNIYAGGAAEARFCSQSFDMESMLRGVSPLKLLAVLLLHSGKLLRLVAFACIECVLALRDFAGGVIVMRNNLFKELKFVPMRVAVCIVLRELIRLNVKMDILRGRRIIHANFLGYDEHAHRRGPASAFAHWTLKGIDDAIADIWRTALRSSCRDYSVVVFSDHGQESTVSYEALHGMPVAAAIRQVFSTGPLAEQEFGDREQISSHASLYERSKQLLLPWVKKKQHVRPHSAKSIQVTALGPVGHVYLPASLDNDQKAAYALRLVREASIPMVLVTKGEKVWAAGSWGCRPLQEVQHQAIGDEHPCLQEVCDDLIATCRHPDAGDFVLVGWQPDSVTLTFAIENGSHCGPGIEETRPFILLPPELRRLCNIRRPRDLRRIALSYLDGNGRENVSDERNLYQTGAA